MVKITPKNTLLFCERMTAYFFIGMLLFLTSGLVWGVFLAAPDYQQKEMVKLLYIHVPSAWLSLVLYGGLALSSFLFLVIRHPLLDIISQGFCKVGLVMTSVCLITGSLWGKPMWGTYWVWDARLTSVAILEFLYVGYWVFRRQFVRTEIGARMCAILAVFGALNLPIIKWSVTFWNTLHQGSSVLRLDGSKIDTAFLWPLLLSTIGLLFYSFLCLSFFIQTEIRKKG